MRAGFGGQRQPRQAHRQATREVEEVELLDVAGQAAQLGHEAGQQRVAQARITVEQVVEDGPREHQRLGRLEGRRGRRVRRAIEQRQLAEEVARPERGDDGLLALRRGQHDLDRAGWRRCAASRPGRPGGR